MMTKGEKEVTKWNTKGKKLWKYTVYVIVQGRNKNPMQQQHKRVHWSSGHWKTAYLGF